MLTRFTVWCRLVVVLAVGLAAISAEAQTVTKIKTKTKNKPLVTTIYLVRHAEKDSTSDAADPLLSAVGQVRAQALRQTLLRHHPVALFTTDTKRTRATLAPLAEALQLQPQVYDPRRGRDMTDRILKEYAGKSVVVVGHSNNVLSLIDDFGATPPVDEIGEKDYEYLFTVRVVQGEMPTVDMRGYGAERKPAIRLGPKAAAAPAPVVSPK